MEVLKILEKKEALNWDYDEEADVLYISITKPQEAIGIDIGEGIIVRYKEDSKEIVGWTIIGFKEWFMNAIKGEKQVKL